MSLSFVYGLAACSDDNTEYGNSDVVVAIPEATWDSSGTSLTVSSSLTGNTANVVRMGFCYSVNTQTPTVNNDWVEADDNFSATITGLNGTRAYYLRAFVYGNSRYTYSETLEVPTADMTIEEQLANYIPPTYADDYTSIADWSLRSQWNLSNVHDPTVVLADDGYYYMYQTDASYGNAHTAGGHFHGRRSRNLVDWEYLGGTMQELPDWVIPKLNEIRVAMGLDEVTATDDYIDEFGYWAPCVRKVGTGLYRMYYSIVCPGTLSGDGTWSERAFIGLMENSDPSNNDGWEDKGYVITNASDRGLNFRVSATDYSNCYYKWNAIDPSYIIDGDGRHYLIYGSWHSGIALVELDAETGMVKAELPDPWGTDEDISAYGRLIATREMGNRWQGSEGPELVYHDGYYYLFLAYDALEVPYNTRVVRSTDIAGPYYGMDGTNVTTMGGDAYPILTHPYKFNDGYGWVGISHCCVFDDGDGNWFFASQGRFPANVGGNAYSNAIMMGHVRSMRWTTDGWPVVMPERYGAVPQAPIAESELVGDWEHIDLSYQYGTQKTSSKMTLADDHSVTEGAWAGATWKYDSDNCRIVFSNGAAVYLQREVDWEADPRTVTIVYSGYGADMNTYWGKKSN